MLPLEVYNAAFFNKCNKTCSRCSAFVLISNWGTSVTRLTSGWISPLTFSTIFLLKFPTLKELTSYGSINVFSKEESSWIWTVNCFKASTRVHTSSACFGATACNSLADALSLFKVGSIWTDMFWMNWACCSLCSFVVWMIFFNFLFSTMKRSKRNPKKSKAAIRITTNVISPTIIYCLTDNLSSFSCIVCRLWSYFCCNAPSLSSAVRAFTESVHTMYLS